MNSPGSIRLKVEWEGNEIRYHYIPYDHPGDLFDALDRLRRHVVSGILEDFHRSASEKWPRAERETA